MGAPADRRTGVWRWRPLLVEDKLISIVERVTIAALRVLIAVLAVGATILLFVLMARNLIAEAAGVASISDLFPAMQRSLGGVLVVVLALELLETLKTYFVDHHIRVEVILVVAIIAVGRHVIQIDFEHTPGIVLLGLSSVIIALTSGYFLVGKMHTKVNVEVRAAPEQDRHPSAIGHH
jgi:uncharacterized membrane protein (DUF373 family)